MYTKIFVRPVKDLKVFHPKTNKPLKSDGEFVPKSPFWTRRLKAGEIEICKKAEKKPAKMKIKVDSPKKDVEEVKE